MTTPADELRAAAQKIRDTAKDATPGPWQIASIPGIGQSVSAPDLTFAVAVEDNWVSLGDAAWIALASPALAEPLAAWLESWDCVELSEHGPMPDDYAHALAVARAINGSAR